MTDNPTPTTDLLKRCAEIHEWRSTGVLSGEALRDYAKRKWPDLRDTLQMAEHETVTEALALLAKWGQPAQAAGNVPAISDLPPLPDPDLRDVGTKPQDVKDFLNGYATEYARLALAARAPADSVQEDAARYRWLREGNDAKHGAAWHVAVNLYGCEWDAAIDAAMNKGGA